MCAHHNLNNTACNCKNKLVVLTTEWLYLGCRPAEGQWLCSVLFANCIKQPQRKLSYNHDLAVSNHWTPQKHHMFAYYYIAILSCVLIRHNVHIFLVCIFSCIQLLMSSNFFWKLVILKFSATYQCCYDQFTGTKEQINSRIFSGVQYTTQVSISRYEMGFPD